MMKENRRRQLYQLLGDLPQATDISAECIRNEDKGAYTLETLVLHLNGIEPVPAYFARPTFAEPPFPVVLFHHSHGGKYDLGKNELIHGNDYLQKPAYAEALTANGYAVLCIDAWGFGERKKAKENDLIKEMLWNGQVLWGMRVYDALRAIDYVCSRPDVAPDRIASLGMSMGSTMAWWTAALDERIRVCVDICGLTDFHTLVEERGLDRHGFYYYVPGLLKHFTTAQINALIAPRPHLSLAGLDDPLTPVRGLDRVDEELRAIYQELGAPQAWKLLRYPVGHRETADMRSDVLAFLAEWLS